MYGIFTYIWVIFSAHVGKYSIHEAYGVGEVGSVGALCRKKNWGKLVHLESTNYIQYYSAERA